MPDRVLLTMDDLETAVRSNAALESEGVELLPEVVALLGLFEPANAAILHSPRLSVRVADARRYVQASSAQYDVIVADLFHPARDGAGSLYTVEHFEAVHHRLAAGGAPVAAFPGRKPLRHAAAKIVRIGIKLHDAGTGERLQGAPAYRFSY